VTKQKEDKMKNDETSKRQETYSAIARQAVKDVTPPPQPTIKLTTGTQLKMTSLILEAHIACLSGHGHFGQILSDSLKLNYGFDAKFPDRDSQKIFNMIMDPKTTPTPYNSDKSDDNDSTTETSDSDMETEQETQPPPKDESVRPKTKTAQTKPKTPKKAQPVKPKRKATSPATATARDSETETQTETVPHPQMTFLRSDRDNSEIPTNPNNDWFVAQLKHKGDYGLKLMTTNCDPKQVLRRLDQGHPKLTLDYITIINHDNFKAKERVSESAKRVRHSSQPTVKQK